MKFSLPLNLVKLLFLITAFHLITNKFDGHFEVNAFPLVANPQDIEFKRYCSNSLAEAIHLICNGRTNSKFQSTTLPGGLSKRFAPDEIFYRPLQNGPIHECCRRACGYEELRQYCAPD